jgi:hypothetical protein
MTSIKFTFASSDATFCWADLHIGLHPIGLALDEIQWVRSKTTVKTNCLLSIYLCYYTFDGQVRIGISMTTTHVLTPITNR